jgi:hypothetical protein
MAKNGVQTKNEVPPKLPLNEGVERKGGVNYKPNTPPPPPPQGQGGGKK